MAARLGLKKLAGFSRQLGTMLDAGLPIRRALSVAERSARPPAKGVYQRIGIAIEQGASLSEALEREGRAFPVLFTRLVRMGEAVGGLDKVFVRLADYYDFIRTVWKRMITQLLYPVFQFWMLIFVLAGVTYIRSMFLEEGNRSSHGALAILGIGALIFFGPIIAYFALTRSLSGSRVAHEVLLGIPVYVYCHGAQAQVPTPRRRPRFKAWGTG